MAVTHGAVRTAVVSVAVATSAAAVLSGAPTAGAQPTPPQTAVPTISRETVADGALRVSVPPVAFPAEVAVVRGRLHTPVLLAHQGVAAHVHVVGAETGSGCDVELTTGVPGWLDCTVSLVDGRSPVVRVLLSDGRTLDRPVSVR